MTGRVCAVGEVVGMKACVVVVTTGRRTVKRSRRCMIPLAGLGLEWLAHSKKVMDL
jgi:hypothetical protein